jgi:hypothetical protein
MQFTRGNVLVAQKDLHRAGDYRAASYLLLFATSSAFRAKNATQRRAVPRRATPCHAVVVANVV